MHAWGEPPRVEDIDPPRRAAGRTIVRMEAATVGHIDRTVWSGAFLRHPPLPYIPGVEGAGRVVASDRLPEGARVWLRGRGLGTTMDGTWCELIDAPDDAVEPLPDAVPMTLGAAFFSPTTSAWVALHEVGRLRPGERVLVTGATGAVGSMAVQLALEAGAQVGAVVASADQARQLPAGVEAVVVDPDPAAPPGTPTADPAAHGPAADLLIDTVGGASLQAVLARIVPSGRAVLVGYTGGTTLQLDLPRFLQRDVALLPLNMLRREQAGRAAVPELLARIADGRLTLPVTAFPLHEASAALDWIVRRGHRGRAVLVADS